MFQSALRSPELEMALAWHLVSAGFLCSGKSILAALCAGVVGGPFLRSVTPCFRCRGAGAHGAIGRELGGGRQSNCSAQWSLATDTAYITLSQRDNQYSARPYTIPAKLPCQIRAIAVTSSTSLAAASTPGSASARLRRAGTSSYEPCARRAAFHIDTIAA